MTRGRDERELSGACSPRGSLFFFLLYSEKSVAVMSLFFLRALPLGRQ